MPCSHQSVVVSQFDGRRIEIGGRFENIFAGQSPVGKPRPDMTLRPTRCDPPAPRKILPDKGLMMLERILEGISQTLKLIAKIAGVIYVLVGGIYLVMPTIMSAVHCEGQLDTNYFTIETWLFWPIGAYNTVALANRLHLPVEKVWIARWCYGDDDSVMQALIRPCAAIGSKSPC
jgi:hypothetical protein